ncbi:hypothetical protein P691DRAFT_777989 [Macrolepiota fuliginosa MF-IS2]|uniref:NACHT domain-containing protein n=1 Tax=Macrolepiota fuliginosa MF-IS2 TaxID=1400762 RepID=A0A9P6C0X6_9AGAR|nr:hypothetical protein P691DRAFT_777989 [Macrolepiota fuliginosa MF-IS2]
MVEFAKHTIPGAAFDDSDRSPPPRCHPGTRLAVLQRARNFFADPQRDKKMLWVVGPAGVGKSAIMQSLAENVASASSDIVLGASLFFSVNGRADGSKTVTTLAYQIAAQDQSYRHFIQNEVATDPTLFRKAMPTQFNKFITEPFARTAVGGGRKRYLILIDGLDECDNNDLQCEILDLISSFCVQHSTTPLVWIIASRPEPHITAFFACANATSHEKEELLIDSDQACKDVERYLRDELGGLRTKYPEVLASFSQWPRERDFIKLFAASGGLFAFAFTAVKFIDNPGSGDPESQLEEFIEVIRDILSQPRDSDEHPMARLDVLYSRIISRIPQRTLTTTKKLLLGMDLTLPKYLTARGSGQYMFAELCNWLNLAPNVAYGALHRLHSVLDIPKSEHAYTSTLRPLHKSFRDYFVDSNRSGMFQDHKRAMDELESECARRVINEASGAIRGSSGVSAHRILLSWYRNRMPRSDKRGLRLLEDSLYLRAMAIVSDRIWDTTQPPQPNFIHLLKLFDVCLNGVGRTRFSPSCLADKRMRRQLKEQGVLHEIPIRNLDTKKLAWGLLDSSWSYRSKSSTATSRALSRDQWHTYEMSGRHTYVPSAQSITWKKGNRIFTQHFKHWQIHAPDLLVAAYIDVRNSGWLFCELPDPDDPAQDGGWDCYVPYRFPSAAGTS